MEPKIAPDSHEDVYATAPGSGRAAVLAFVMIALAGYCGFYAVYAFRQWDARLVHLPAFHLTVLLPAALAIGLHFPTDKLSRVIANVAAGAGAACLVATLVVSMAGAHASSSTITYAVIGIAVSGGLAIVARRLLRRAFA